MSEAAIGVAIPSCPGVQPRRSYSRLHAIIADSASFANSAERFANNSASDKSAPEGKETKKAKTKFSCPQCGQNAWAKPGAQLICGVCYDNGEGEISVMLAEPDHEAAVP